LTPGWKRAVVVARARRNVAERALRAAVNDAALAGAGDAEIATSLRIPRDAARRLLAELVQQRGPDGKLPDDAYAVAERYAAGELSRERMLELLIAWPYVADPGTPGWNEISVLPKGSFAATVGEAHADGLISGDDYEEILQALVERSGGDG
jgi:hypothetical protein